jgi:hypothetical protein
MDQTRSMARPFSEALDARDCGLITASLTANFNLVELDVPGLVPAADDALLFILYTFHLRLSVASRDACTRGPEYLGNNAD